MSSGNGEKLISTDVLVIGGGIGGCFAAVKAKEQGLDVTIVDKNYVGKSGATHFAEGDLMCFNPERGHKLNEWMDRVNKGCEYLNNREWSEIILKEARQVYKDLLSWGVKFYEEGGEVHVNNINFYGQPTLWENVHMLNRKYAPVFRKKALESGIRILDRIMIGELLKQDGIIVGAVGFDTTNGDLYILKAKATVMVTGTASLNKTEKMPLHFLTGDGECMAYRAGAEITGKEFKFGQYLFANGGGGAKVPVRETSGPWQINDLWDHYPAFRIDELALKGQPIINVEGEVQTNPHWAVHLGQAPLFRDLDTITDEQMEWIKRFFRRVGTAQPDKVGLDITKRGKLKYPGEMHLVAQILGGGHGIWPVNTKCATALPGLYAAGDCCGTRASGALYAGFGWGLNHAPITGTRAGLAAAEYASQSKEISIDEAVLASIKKIVCSPVERKGGFTPGWVMQVLQGYTVPYYVLQIKHGERLQATLALVEFLNNHIVPKLVAKDAHEWRMAYEAKNMVLNAEMVLRASLYRTESRGSHFREDFPRRDDPTWLAWVKLRDEQGKMKALKEPVPKKWWPDLSEPYEKRYPSRFPLE